VRSSEERDLAALECEVVSCRRCPRLVAWRELVARERRAAFADQEYWGRPLPGFGDPQARVLVLGLAPAAHGANRTGRMFTGDRSGDFLYAAMWRAGMATQPTATARGDGLQLRDAWVTAAVRCAPPANKPTPDERDACLPWSVRELELLSRVRVIVCLGAFAWNAALRLSAAVVAGTGAEGSVSAVTTALPRPRPRFGHGAEYEGARYTLIGCYHPSQQNTFTGKLTEPMIDTVLARARELGGGN
jgi:uracil-DNA glycosylase